MLSGKKILIGISGSIAAYKMPLLVRLLVKEGAEVRIIMTPAAKDFVAPLVLSTLSRNTVLSEMFDETSWSNHVMLGRWADIMLLAPLSCNTLSKMANGQCDNLLLATYLSATTPVAVAPAMDEDMWHHPTTVHNLDILKKNGTLVLPVGFGELASGLTGEGRMAEPEDMLQYLNDFFTKADQLRGKKVLITAGPTLQPLDPVRFLGNHSSGKMGFALADEAQKRGAQVTLISGPVSVQNAVAGVQLVRVTTAEEMYEACLKHADYDLAILAAAVADYTPSTVSQDKIKKQGEEMTLTLKKTKDILATLGKQKRAGQILVGFALETNKEEENALKKLNEKNADLIVLNSLNDEGAGFGHDTNKATLFFKNGEVRSLQLQTKQQLAEQIIDSIT
jgi:phosphopantothenoylcysteine decarboxylase / phosphopantothenate---cysteine ligase